MSHHDEYTDYSCSTSVERLARDVETFLRSWHLVGSDQHVSFYKEPKKPSMNTSKLGAHFASNSNSVLHKQTSKSVHSAPARPEPTKDVEAIVQMIRSEHTQWIVALYDGTKVVVPLILTLWDGPSRRSDEDDKHLAQSMKRLPLLQMPHDPFANLSTLFGIGQHITLSLQPGTEVSSDLLWALGGSMIQRHSDQLSPWMMTASLSGMLQTTLHCAISNISCRIPAFGIWGVYMPAQQNHSMPSWLQSIQSSEPKLFPPWMMTPSTQLPTRRRSSLFQRFTHLNHRYLPPILSANLLDKHSFCVSVLPLQAPSNTRITEWGQFLLKHSNEDTVLLYGARHVYKWKKVTLPSPLTSTLFRRLETSEWRSWTELVIDPNDAGESVENYRTQCQSHAIHLLEQALGASFAEPMWGSPDDPISSVHVHVTWNGTRNDDGTIALLSFPLKIRSQQSMTKLDWQDMEESVERSVLNPLLPTSFMIQARYDRTTSISTLAASQRCLLAALIRTATLPSNVLLYHLTNEAIMDQWSTETVEAATTKIVTLANVSNVTRQLVDAMDWTSVADDMIEPWQARRILQQVFDGTVCLGFPSPPEGVFATNVTHHGIHKSAPPGRLVSLLFLHMTRLRAPSSMTLLWMTFIEELRHRWNHRDSLPNMGHIPGLDPSPDLLTKKRGCASIGVKADCSAFLHSSEPDPDDFHCLIGQKLQVFNIGIECTVALEMRSTERLEQRVDIWLEPQQKIPSNEVDDIAIIASTECKDGKSMTSKGMVFPYQQTNRSSIVEGLPSSPATRKIFQEEQSMYSGSTNRMEFYDAMEGSVMLQCEMHEADDDEDLVTNLTSLQGRQGARCPVHGAALVASGDQVYAPYLQRPTPLTDDLILERRTMLSPRSDTNNSTKDNVRSRVEIAHRLQKPKLLSDMMAFKAANPGAVFQDFTTWYGNPGNPLDDYNDAHTLEVRLGALANESVSVKLNYSSEANQILLTTRDFWSATWDEATACPAIDQEPLFDAMNAVEMVLDHLGTMHPASLMNQIMAVNLSTCYFALVTSAGETNFVDVVAKALDRLKVTASHAIELLSRDVTHGCLPHDEVDKEERLPRYASLEAIRACDAVCNSIADTEVLTCRAMSLLHKFPHQYELVNNMLRRADAEPTSLDSQEGRQGILAAIASQQESNVAMPSLQEYMLRNTNDACPSHLCVRLGRDDGGLMIAMTKSRRVEEIDGEASSSISSPSDGMEGVANSSPASFIGEMDVDENSASSSIVSG